jgi:ankyrin repeat protein
MSESRGINYKHWIRRKNRPFWQCCWVRTLRPTTATAEPDGRARGRIGSRSSPIDFILLIKIRPIDCYILIETPFQWIMAFSENELWRAISMGNKESVKTILLQSDIDINWTNQCGVSCLMIAATTGKAKVAKLLLQRTDIDVNMVDRAGNTALMLASSSGHLNVVETLLQRQDVDINKGDNNGHGWTALMQATRYGHISVMEALLNRKDIDVNKCDGHGWTALLVAARHGKEYLVCTLLKVT